MNGTLSEAAQWAAVLSPLVAVGVFAASLVYDRWKRRSEARARALTLARGTLLKSLNWTLLPYPASMFGGWPTQVFDAVSGVAATIPPKRYGDLSIWLIEGVVLLVKEPTSAVRKDIQTKLNRVVFEQQLFGRRGLRSAQQYARVHPWPKPTPVPRRWALMIETGAVALRAIAGDSTYARRPD